MEGKKQYKQLSLLKHCLDSLITLTHQLPQFLEIAG